MNTRCRKAKKILSPHSPAPGATVLGVSIFLMAITWLVFGETLRHPSINFDDQEYVFEIEVSGCQFSAWECVKAQRTPVEVKPVFILGFSKTYS